MTEQLPTSARRNAVLAFVPLILISVAMISAAVLAYGTEPLWASLNSHGLGLILWSRRLEWPLIVAALMLCAALLFVVIAGKRRIFWLIGLLPVLVLIYHRFSAGPSRGLLCLTDPPTLAAERATNVNADELVVGLILDNQPVAFPTSQLFRAPVIVESNRGKPVLLLWSAFANRALLVSIDRDVRTEDLEIISSPENALMIYNSRLGQFINGITGKTFKGETPTGFHNTLPVSKTTWGNWKLAHPDTQVATIQPVGGSFAQPLTPQYKMHGVDLSDTRRICVIATTQPIAVASDQVSDKPLNLSIGTNSLLLVRVAGTVRVFNRELPGDLVPRFFPAVDPKHPAVAWTDSDTNSEWNTKGEWVAGNKDMAGKSLTPVPVEDDLYWNVMSFWYPDLHLTSEAEIAAAKAGPVVKPPDRPSNNRRRTPRRP